ncbi:MAG TPA: sulfur transferase domain-containing protein [Vicinamibacterales bacterium]|nr:sulfur transferase domain-containing protein [Vicinamibacterales bacterium]
MRLTTFALCLTLAAPLAAQTKQDFPGVTNFTRVDATVACGGAAEVAALDALKKDGFKTVINLRVATEPGANIEQNQAKAKELGLNYVHIPFSGASPDPKVIDTFLATIANTANQPVFVHCASANRVGAVWLAKRVLQDDYSIEKATTEAKAIGLSSPALEKFALQYIADHKP